MKRGLFCIVFLLFLNFASASVVVHNSTFNSTYTSDQKISGILNITLTNENLNENITTNLGHSISLRDLFDENGLLDSLNCTPRDCKAGFSYNQKSSEKQISLLLGQEKYIGFILNGTNIRISGIEFDITSDFSRSTKTPLTIDFFQGTEWKFSEFSDEFSDKNYGNYNPQESSQTNVPLLNAKYCEKINVQKTNALKVGAEITGQRKGNLKLSIYEDDVSGPIDDCIITETESSCIIPNPYEELFEGEYYVCISTGEQNTNQGNLSSENTGALGGFFPSTVESEFSIPENFTRDYSLFAMPAKYENGLSLSSQLFDFSSLSDLADSYIQERYGSDCSESCILPISFSGTNQNIEIQNASIIYSREDRSTQENYLYSLSKIPAKASYSGKIDLSLLDFNLTEKNSSKFILYLGNTKIFEHNITILKGAKIKDVYPRNPPAGFETEFIADVESSDPITQYKWDFGNDTITTTENKVFYTYETLGPKVLTLEVTSKGITTTKSFPITIGSPRAIINVTYDYKKRILNNVIAKINTFPGWYQEKIKKIANIDFFSSELERLKRAKERAYEDSDFLKVVLELNNLTLPYSVYVAEDTSTPLITQRESIDLNAITSYAGGNYDEKESEKYKDAILRWTTKNIESQIRFQKVSLVNELNEHQEILMVYSVKIKSNSMDDSYFIIDKPKSDLIFKSETKQKKAAGKTLIEIPSETEKQLDFYYEGDSPVEFFISPKLGLLQLEADIDETCNFNYRCEKENGENYKNCRTDCKPLGWTIFYIILLLFITAVVYTILQEWYKRKYETYLFKDRKLLFNLLMFISNARTQGMTDDQIRQTLEKQKWSKERIDYAIKKSRGQRTGMYELIPIEKLFAFNRNRNSKNKKQQNAPKKLNRW